MVRKHSEGLWKHLDFLILDLFCFIGALYISFYLRESTVMNLLEKTEYRIAFVIMAFVHIMIAMFTNIYSGILRRNLWQESIHILKHVILVMASVVVMGFFAKIADALSRLIIAYTVILSLLFLFFMHILWKSFIKKRLSIGKRMVMLVSDQAGCKRICKRMEMHPNGYEIVAMYLIGGNTDSVREEKSASDKIRLYQEEEVLQYLKTHVVDEILFSVPTKYEFPLELFQKVKNMGIAMHLESVVPEGIRGMNVRDDVAGIPVLSSYIKEVTMGEAFFKRTVDILGGLIGIIFTAILCIIIGPLIYFSDPGPIFFSQVRVGMNGRKFRIYKFRSMYQDAEERKKDLMKRNEMKGLMFKMDEDPRIIGSGKDGKKHGIGHFIRATSIDEFPQFLNVLKGDMSLVGTRPPTVEEFEQYDVTHHIRLAVKPGITGLWQVSGRNNIKEFEEVVKLDAEYIEKWSLWLDIKILFKTVGVVLFRQGAK